MKRLARLLRIVPSLVPLAPVIRALMASRTLDDHEGYHAALPRSLEVRSDDLEDGGRFPTVFTCEGECVSHRSPEEG